MKFRKSILVFLILLFVSAPLFLVAHGTLNFSFEWFTHFAGTVLPGYFFDSLKTLLTALCAAFLFGSIPAWLVFRYSFTGYSLGAFVPMLPLTIPAYVLAGIYVEAVDADWLFTPWALGFLIGAATSPFVYLFARIALARFPLVFVDAARSLGCRARRRATALFVPLLLPFVLGALLLVASEGLSDLAAASRLGVSTFSVGLHNQWLSLQRDEIASMFALLLLGIAICLALPPVWHVLRRPIPNPAMSLFTHEQKKLGFASSCLMHLGLMATVLPGFIVPCWLSVHWTAQKIDRINLSQLPWDAGSSIVTSLLTVALCLGCAFVVFFLSDVGERTGRAERMTWVVILNYLVPALVIAFAIEKTGWGGMTQSRLDVVIACSIRFLPFVILPTMEALSRVPTMMFDSAVILSRSRLAALYRGVLPVLGPSMIAGAILVFTETMKELTISMTLQPFDYSVLSTRIFAYTGLHLQREASAWTISLMLICLYPLWRLSEMLNTVGKGADSNAEGV